MAEIANRLRERRARLNWTLREAGERSGVSYVTISRYEQCQLSVTVETLIKLAAAYGLKVIDLIPDEAVELKEKAKLASKKKTKPDPKS